MDFDPLENILSDSSDDSFFGKQSKTIAKNTGCMTESSVGHQPEVGDKALFSTSFSNNKAIENSGILTGPSYKICPETETTVSTKTVEKTSIIDNESDLVIDLGFDPKKPKAAKVNTNNLFWGVEPERFSRQSTETTESITPGTYTKTLLRPKVVSDKQFLSADDPLGFLTSNKEKQNASVHVKNHEVSKTYIPIDKQDKELSFAAKNTENDGANPDAINISKIGQLGSFGNAHIELQSSLNGLRLEEARVLLAAQMNVQEQLLHEMRKKQDSVFLHQEEQFNNMLKKHSLRKNELENAIRVQEERIRLQLQTLTSVPILETSFSNTFTSGEIVPSIDMAYLKDALNKLKEENQHLGNLLANMSDNHRKEIELQEESHKNLIKLFEKNFRELAVQSKDNEKNSENQNAKLIENYDKKLKDIREQHDTSIINLRKYYDAEIEMLKKENKWMIEHFQSQFKSCGSVGSKHYNVSLECLDAAFVDLKDLVKNMREVLNEIHSATGKYLNQREEKLITREKHIEGREHRLRLLQESSQTEHAKLWDLVLPLEALLRDFTKGNMKEKVDLLHAERLSLNRERELFLELVETKGKHIQESQKLQEAEKTFYLRQIQEEWRLLYKAKEKLSPEMQSDVEIPRFDLCSSFKDSKDSKTKIDTGKERVPPLQNVLEPNSCADVKEIRDWERIKDEFLKGIQHLKLIGREVHELLQRTQLTEKRFNSIVQILKEQMKHMNVREGRLSKGRYELAQGHFRLQSTINKDDYYLCNTCKTVFANHSSYDTFEKKLWSELFFNVHERL